MPTCRAVRSRIDHPIACKGCPDRVPATIARYGGRALARGGHYRILERPQGFQRCVAIEFPTLGQVVDYHDSPAYGEAAAFSGSRGGEIELVIVAGGDATPR